MLFAVLTSLSLVGCQGCEFPLNFGGGASVEEAYQEIREINPRELELCRVVIGPPPSSTGSFASGSSFGGSSSGNSSISNSPTRRSDAATWQSELDRRLHGDEPADNPAPSTSTSRATQSAPRSLPAYTTPTYQNGEIIRIDVLRRDDHRSAYIVVSESGREATSTSGGYARVVTTRTRKGRSQEQTFDDVRVTISYQLSRSSGGWRCIAANAEPVGTGSIPRTATGGSLRSNGSRIGW